MAALKHAGPAGHSGPGSLVIAPIRPYGLAFESVVGAGAAGLGVGAADEAGEGEASEACEAV